MSFKNREGFDLFPSFNLMNLKEVSNFLGIPCTEIVRRINNKEFPFPQPFIMGVWERHEMEAIKNGK